MIKMRQIGAKELKKQAEAGKNAGLYVADVLSIPLVSGVLGFDDNKNIFYIDGYACTNLDGYRRYEISHKALRSKLAKMYGGLAIHIEGQKGYRLLSKDI